MEGVDMIHVDRVGSEILTTDVEATLTKSKMISVSIMQ